MTVGEIIRQAWGADNPPSSRKVEYPTHWCEDCFGLVDVTRDGSCAACGGRSVVRKKAERCHLCGGGPEEGTLVAGIVHRTCIPTFVRRAGEGAVQDFTRRLV